MSHDPNKCHLTPAVVMDAIIIAVGLIAVLWSIS